MVERMPDLPSSPNLALVTARGCTIRVVPHSYLGSDFIKTVGPEVTLVLRMEQPDDGRWAEVLLTPAERATLAAHLMDPVWDTLGEGT